MAIKKYTEKGKTLYQVYVCLRTKRGLRKQKKRSKIETEKEALKLEREFLRECERSLLKKESSGELWSKVLDHWIEFTHRRKDIAQTTREDYISMMYKHTSSWKSRYASSISSDDVKELLESLQEKEYNFYYLKRIKALLHQAFLKGIKQGFTIGMERPPTYGVALKLSREKKRPEILTLDELRFLLEQAKKLNHSWYPIWAFAVLTGMRNGELFALNWSDIDFKNREVSVTKSYNGRLKITKSTKSGDWRTIPISSELLRLLQETLKPLTGETEFVLPRLRAWRRGQQAEELRKFCLGLNIKSVKFHTLRACFATQLIRNGVPPIQIQKICGWVDLKTMQRYIRLAGIETQGATEVLKVLPSDEALEKVTTLF